MLSDANATIMNRHEIPVPVAATRALADCAIGRNAVIVDVSASAGDACRLRALGVFEGAEVRVVGTRPGLLIEVRGTRLVLGTELAATVGVRPLDIA